MTISIALPKVNPELVSKFHLCVILNLTDNWYHPMFLGPPLPLGKGNVDPVVSRLIEGRSIKLKVINVR